MTMYDHSHEQPATIPAFPPPSGETLALREIARALERIALELHQLHVVHEDVGLWAAKAELNEKGMERIESLIGALSAHPL